MIRNSFYGSKHQSMINIIVTSLTNSFLKFLTRFSGRRRMSRRNSSRSKIITSHSSHYFYNCKLNFVIPILLLLSTICGVTVTDACSTRTTPKPRPTTTTPRPKTVSNPIYKCPEVYAAWYCLNGATCSMFKINSEYEYYCECTEGYIGLRCDYKSLDGSYLAARKLMLKTASIAGGAAAAVFLSCVVGFFIYVRWHQKKKREGLQENIDDATTIQENGHQNDGVDTVDGHASASTCYCQQSQVYFSQLSSNLDNQTSSDNSGLQHPQQQQFNALPHLHHSNYPPKRPFGPHHYHPLPSMSDVLLKR